MNSLKLQANPEIHWKCKQITGNIKIYMVLKAIIRKNRKYSKQMRYYWVLIGFPLLSFHFSFILIFLRFIIRFPHEIK